MENKIENPSMDKIATREIISNGSICRGMFPNSVEYLIALLKKHKLSSFSKRIDCGSYIKYFGNFDDISNVFEINCDRLSFYDLELGKYF